MTANNVKNNAPAPSNKGQVATAAAAMSKPVDRSNMPMHTRFAMESRDAITSAHGSLFNARQYATLALLYGVAENIVTAAEVYAAAHGKGDTRTHAMDIVTSRVFDYSNEGRASGDGEGPEMPTDHVETANNKPSRTMVSALSDACKVANHVLAFVRKHNAEAGDGATINVVGQEGTGRYAMDWTEEASNVRINDRLIGRTSGAPFDMTRLDPTRLGVSFNKLVSFADTTEKDRQKEITKAEKAKADAERKAREAEKERAEAEAAEARRKVEAAEMDGDDLAKAEAEAVAKEAEAKAEKAAEAIKAAETTSTSNGEETGNGPQAPGDSEAARKARTLIDKNGGRAAFAGGLELALPEKARGLKAAEVDTLQTLHSKLSRLLADKLPNDRAHAAAVFGEAADLAQNLANLSKSKRTDTDDQKEERAEMLRQVRRIFMVIGRFVLANFDLFKSDREFLDFLDREMFGDTDADENGTGLYEHFGPTASRETVARMLAEQPAAEAGKPAETKAG